MSDVDVVNEIRKKQEDNIQLNIDVNLPPRLITRKICERIDVEKDGYENVITVEKLGTSYTNIEYQATLNTIKKILRKFGLPEKIKREFLYILV